ncbi:MAG: hypothetical protein LBK44_00570 [Spirochaetales bacterium]|nr:hypothetical protein [Spirochaetales bacterium]
MPDFKAGENIEKLTKKVEGLSNHPFFVFSKPYLNFIEKGKMFGFFYLVMAVVSLLLPIVVIVMVVKSGFFEYGGAKFVIAFIFCWLVIVFACWIGFQIWWDRKSRIKNVEASEFIATPIFAEILQTLGEWAGTLIGIIGAGVGLIATIVLGEAADSLFGAIGLEFMSFGAVVVIIGPVIGFFFIIVSRFIAEQVRIFAALANNTKEIAVNVKGKNAGGV